MMWRKHPVDTMQWLSIGLVVVSGIATLLTADPRFVMLKPSVIYCIVGAYMLKPGWMTRYLPPIAVLLIELVSHRLWICKLSQQSVCSCLDERSPAVLAIAKITGHPLHGQERGLPAQGFDANDPTSPPPGDSTMPLGFRARA